MRVLLDSFNLLDPVGTGLKNYAREVGLAAIEAGHRVELLTDYPLGKNASVNQILLEDPHAFHSRKPIPRKWRWTLWPLSVTGVSAECHPVRQGAVAEEVSNIPFAFSRAYAVPACFYKSAALFEKFQRFLPVRLPNSPELVHFTYPIPLKTSGLARVSTLHDIIPLRLPHCTIEHKQRYHKMIQKTLDLSDMVACDSEHTRRDILELMDVPAEKLAVLPLSYYRRESEETEEAFCAPAMTSLGLTDQNYFLMVGNIEPRKNFLRVAQAYAQLKTDRRLVVVGRKAWLWEKDIETYEKLIRPSLRHPVIFLDYVEDAIVATLYRHAYALLFASLYEGFGLPALEAMSRGCPVIAADNSSLPELCQKAALYVNPWSVDSILDGMRRLDSDAGERQRLASLCRDTAAGFSRKQFQDILMLVYRQALENFKSRPKSDR